MRIHSRRRGQSGFSLIEVLIAVVVLATGLLSLAALQGKLSTNSADAKARSRIAALLTSVVDSERSTGYGGISAFSGYVASTGACLPANDASLTTFALMAKNAINCAQSDAGLSGLSLSQTVATFCGVSGGNTFAAGACTNVDDAEYKQLVLTAAWNDATGAARTLAATTIVSALNLSTSTTLLDTPLTATTITPVVHQPNPGLTNGVIPIAVGTNASGNETDTASTNPRPTVGVTLPSTTFNTLTYGQGALDSSITRTIQKRVETTVAECGCKYSSSNPFTVGNGANPTTDVFLGTNSYRPTYWNGNQYVSPTSVKLVSPYSGQSPDLIGSQSDMCSLVCRDHHDTSSDTIKFDSVTGDYNRYALSTDKNGGVATPVALALDGSGKPIAATTTDGSQYLDAARLIRVDGLWRVATDMHAEYVGLLATQTASSGYATSPNTDDTAETNYGGKTGFVVDYIGQRVSQILSGGSAPDGNALYKTHGLDIPALISTDKTSGNFRYLHARGLYLDAFEQPLIDKLTNIKTNSCTTYPDCVLAYLPFNTINATQLASWSRLSSTKTTRGTIDVKNSTTSNTAVLCTTGNKATIIRGCVSGTSADDGSSNPYDQAIATMGKSNSAVAASVAISPYDLANKLSDAQDFSVSGTAVSSEFFAAVSGVTYTLPNATTGLFWTDDLSTTNEPTLTWTLGSSSDFCSGTINTTDANPNPYDCVTTAALTVPFTVVMGNYNQVVQQQTTYTTTSGGTGTVQQPVLVCYKVTAASIVQYPVSGSPVVDAGYSVDFATVTNSGAANETTTFSITGSPATMVKSSRQLNITLAANGTKAGTIASTDPATGIPTYSTPTSCL